MKSLRQLLRQPLKSLAGLLLVALAGGLLCANAGQYVAALRTREQIERDYTTAALSTGKYMKQERYDENGGFIGYTFLAEQPYEIRQFLAGLETEHPGIIRQVDRLGLISGYCPAVTPFNYVQTPYHASYGGDVYSVIRNEPYTTAVLAVTLETVGPIEEEGGGMTLVDTDGNRTEINIGNPKSTVSLTGRIDQAVFLQEGFPDPTGRTLRFTVTGETTEELQALDLRVGERYLVAGNDYSDEDWRMRRELVDDGFVDVSNEVDWDNIWLASEIDNEIILEQMQVFGALGVEKVATYAYGDIYAGYHFPLGQYQLDRVNASSLNVYTLSPVQRYHYEYMDGFTVHDISELIAHKETAEYQQAAQAAEAEFNSLYTEPSIARLDGTAEEFLASPDGTLWKDYMAQAEITNHSLPLLTTPRLESVVQFVRGDTVISQGRSFTDAEYRGGSRVCVLSESLAAANGLSVGDRIPISLYTADPNYREHASNTANPSSDRYSAAQGFAAEEEEYEIVGLYRQTDEWGRDAYAFLPNTVFVPEKAVTAETRTGDSGIFQTILLKNGAQEKMEALLEEAGYPELFAYYDQGYDAIASQLDEYLNNVRTSCIAGAAAWAVIFLLFLALFPLSQRKTARRMWALGAMPGHIMRHVLAGGAGLALPGTVLGGALGYVFLQRALERSAADTGLALGMGAWTVPALAGVQLLAGVAAIFLCGVFVARTGQVKEAR